jgi:hypothetical protein
MFTHKKTMLTYYQVSRPRKIKVRVVKAHEQVQYLNSPNVVDTRQFARRPLAATFFLNPAERQLTELEAWSKLSRKMLKRAI